MPDTPALKQTFRFKTREDVETALDTGEISKEEADRMIKILEERPKKDDAKKPATDGLAKSIGAMFKKFVKD